MIGILRFYVGSTAIARLFRGQIQAGPCVGESSQGARLFPCFCRCGVINNIERIPIRSFFVLYNIAGAFRTRRAFLFCFWGTLTHSHGALQDLCCASNVTLINIATSLTGTLRSFLMNYVIHSTSKVADDANRGSSNGRPLRPDASRAGARRASDKGIFIAKPDNYATDTAEALLEVRFPKKRNPCLSADGVGFFSPHLGSASLAGP